MLCPFLLLNYALWHLRHRVLSREDRSNEVAPGIWLGRRPLKGELPAGVTTVVDMTAEFSADLEARKLNYICVQTLDGYAPSDEEFHRLMAELQDSSGPVYIHCAAGHGRSAAVAVALLLARGLASDLAEAESIVRSKRPQISIKKPQMDLLQRWFEGGSNGASYTPRQVRSSDYLPAVVELVKRVFSGALAIFVGSVFYIGGPLVGVILAVSLPGKLYSDYLKDPASTIFGLACGLIFAFVAWWANRHHAD